MNILYIFGNGFDLSLGLNTSYGSFLKHYLYNHQPNTDPFIEEFKKEVWKDIDTWTDLETRLGQWLNEKVSRDRAIAIHDDLVKELSLYMKNEQERVKPNAKVREQILSNMANVSHHLRRNLDKRDITNYISKYVNNTPHVISTITLNYTDTFERLAFQEGENMSQCTDNKINFKFNRPIHLHGTVDEGIVLGVNDEAQVSNKQLIKENSIRNRFIKTSTINDVYRTGYEEQAINAIDAAHLICVYGTSFGKTDTRIWNRIVSRVVKSNIQVILFHYGSDTFGGNEGPKMMDKIENLNQKFVSYGIISNTGQPVSIPSSVLGVYDSDIFKIKVDVIEQKPVYLPDEAEMLAGTQKTIKEALKIK